MSFDNTKYHVNLNNVGYQISGYSKREMLPFIPRLGAGDQSESQFDLLRSMTQSGFGGGALQRFLEDETSFFGSTGLYPVYDDGVLYPVNAFTESKELFTTTKAKITAVLISSSAAYIAYRLYGSTNALKRLDSDGTITNISLPANISSTNRSIISIVRSSNTVIWIGTDDGLSMGYMANGSSTSVTEVGSGTAVEAVSNLIMFRGELYGLDGSQGSESNSKLYRHTGGLTARTKVLVGSTAGAYFDSRAKLVIYNNRIMIMTNRGMWAYDGVQVVSVEDTGIQTNDKNYRFPVVLRGYLYYFMADGMYRFNGSLIEKLYDVSEIGTPTSVTTGGNRMWLAFSNSSAVFSSRYDKAMGYDYSAGNTVNGRVMCFDGKGMFEYARTADWTQATPDFTGQGEVSDIFWFANKIHLHSNYDKIGTGGSGVNRYYTVTTNETANSGNKVVAFITSIFDGGFPMIDKNLDNMELVLDGYMPSDQTITIAYRTGGFDGSTSFTTLGTFSTQTELKRLIFKTIAAGLTFRQIQFKLSSSALDVRVGMRKLITRYTLSPDFKWQWAFSAECYGDQALAPLMLADDTESSQTVRSLRGNIYDARQSDQPVLFIDIDQLDLNGAHNNSVTTITVNSTSMLKESGFIQIDDEIIYYTGKTSTTLTGCTRGVLGSSAASHSDNAKVFPVYRVLLEIQNERVEMTEPTTDATEDKSRSSVIQLLLKEV